LSRRRRPSGSSIASVPFFLAKIGIGSGILTLLLTPLIKRWMHGVK